jgi:hypothetical protein
MALRDGSFPEVTAPETTCDEGMPCAAGAPQVLASQQPTPAGVALDDTYVYWVDLGTTAGDDGGSDGGLEDVLDAGSEDGLETGLEDVQESGSEEVSETSDEVLDAGSEAGPAAGRYIGARVERCAKTGCGDAPQVLAAGSWNGMSKVVVQASNVYWVATGEVLACPVDGCPGSPAVVWSGTDILADLAVDATGAYFTDPAAASLLMCPSSGCTGSATQLYPPTAEAAADAGFQYYGPPWAIALDSGNVYFTTTFGNVLSCSETDCAGTLQVLAERQGTPVQIAVDGANVYFTDYEPDAHGRVLSCAKSGCGERPTVLLDSLNDPLALATDGTSVYFTEQGSSNDGGTALGRVASCKASGCGDRATAVAGFVNQPRGIAVDSARVYWADFGSSARITEIGRVMAAAK